MKERLKEVCQLIAIILGILAIVFIFTGCAPRIEYVPKLEVKEVKVPVAMKIKRIQCNFVGETPDIVVDKMLICLKRFKTYNEHLIKASDEINKEAEEIEESEEE